MRLDRPWSHLFHIAPHTGKPLAALVKKPVLKKTVQLHAKIDESLSARIATMANHLDRSVSWLVRHYIERGLKVDEEAIRKAK